MWEAVLLSITPSFTQAQVDKDTTIGAQLQIFKENIDQPLSAILTLNTIAHTVGAIGVGAQAATIWADANPLITSLLVPAIMTIAILIFSEIIPKTLGANFWRELAPFTVASLIVLIKLLLPFVWVSQKITQTLKREKSASVFTRSDFLAMTEIGRREGVFEEQQSDVIKNLIRFKSVCARDVMTPRTVMVTASRDQSIEDFLNSFEESVRFSRIPVYGETPDQITGYVLKDDLLEKHLLGQGQQTLSEIERKLITIEDTESITTLFQRFLDSQGHIAIAVDEFGGVAGLVTMEDVIETLLGFEIIDEFDETDDLQVLARRNWERRAKRIGLGNE